MCAEDAGVGRPYIHPVEGRREVSLSWKDGCVVISRFATFFIYAVDILIASSYSTPAIDHDVCMGF